jgi:hypothetical protein
MSPPYRYRPDILAALVAHGVEPTPATPPAKVRELVSDLYRFQIRDLKLRLKELERVLGPQPMDAYRQQVLALKARYGVLRREAQDWVL